MRKHNFVVRQTAAVAVLVLASAQAWAQAPSFDEIVKMALATHPAILSRQSSSLAAKADLQGADWQRYPTPSVEFDNDNKSARSTLFRLQQPLWAGGRISAGIDAAGARLQSAETAISETKLEVVQRVISAYVEALRQRGREETIARGVEQHESLLGLITRRVEHEASPRVDQDLAQSRLYQANNDLSTVRQALANAFTQLSQLAGKRIDAVAALDADALADPQSVDTALEKAIAFSPTLRRLAFDDEAAKADAEAAKSIYQPRISARYEHASASAPINGIVGFTTNRVMLVVEAQTGAGLSALSGVDAAIAKREATRLQRETALRDLRERVSIDWDDLIASRKRLENAVRASTSSKEVYESYARQYTAGRKTWLDVLNTVRESTQSDVAAVDARAQVTGAKLRLQLETGNLLGLVK